MYFKNKKDTNIDSEFGDGNLFSKIVQFVYKYKDYFVIGFILLIILVVGIIMIIDYNVTNYLYLNGEDNITIYQGTDYIEPGYVAYNSKKVDLSKQVRVVSTLNNNKVGIYEITYSINDVVKKRRITVVDRPQEYIYIYLKPVKNNIDVYLKKGDDYIEPGYQVFSNTGKTLTNEVKITGSVDTSKVGNYKLVYSVVDSSGVTVSVSRTVIVMDADVSLSLNNDNYTNGDVNIEILVVDNYFDYIILPNGNKVTDSSYSYKVSNNGVYKFMVYSKKGLMKEASIEVKNIDRKAPTGSCEARINSNSSVITINAKDVSGIKKYSYNGKDYNSNMIKLSFRVDNASVTIYDNAGNSSVVNCKTIVTVPASSSSKPASSSSKPASSSSKPASSSSKPASSSSKPSNTKPIIDNGGSRVIFIGDSRTVLMYSYVANTWENNSYSTGGINQVGNDLFVAQGSMGLSWMQSTAIPAVEKYFTRGVSIVILMGVNDLRNQDKYIEYLNSNVSKWTKNGARVYFVTVNPCDGEYASMNTGINNFNDNLKKNLSNKVGWINTHDNLQFKTLDGLHYNEETSIKIYNFIKSKL